MALMFEDTAVNVPSPSAVCVFNVKDTVPAPDKLDSVAEFEPVAVTPTPAPARLMASAITLAPDSAS